MENKALKISPYGVANYATIRERGLAYVDKTRFIEVLEEAKVAHPLIVRPRRFGKTLFARMLFSYYDKAAKADFERNFSETYIGKHRTPFASQYYVVKFDFSGMGSDSNIAKGFYASVCAGLSNFFDRYPNPKQEEILSDNDFSASRLLRKFLSLQPPIIKGKLYVIVDEYDQFSSEVLSKDVGKFKKITASGFVKDFYTTLKSFADDGIVSHVFITGVTSLQIDSMTSGFSIAKNLSTDPRFSSMFGFTDEELRGLIPQLVDLKRTGKTLDEVFSRMKELYNGYHFSPASQTSVFNASMCLYYLDYLSVSNEEPDQLIDPAVAEDLQKIHSILSLGSLEDVREIVSCAIAKKFIPFSNVLDSLNLQDVTSFSKEKILSCLFYLGFLTYEQGKTNLVVPNRTIAQQFFDAYFEYLQGVSSWGMTRSSLFESEVFALHQGKSLPLIEKVVSIIDETSGKNSSLHLQESVFQVALLMAANNASGYEYFTELEVRGKEKGFADLLLRSTREGSPSYIFELKYLPKSRGTTRAVQNALSDAKEQVSRYVLGENVRTIPSLKRVAVVVVGTKIAAFSEEG